MNFRKMNKKTILFRPGTALEIRRIKRDESQKKFFQVLLNKKLNENEELE
jgi:hypothetical protein